MCLAGATQVDDGYRNHPDRFYQHAAHPARGQSVEHHRAEYLGGGGAGGHPGCELFYQDVQKVDGQHPHPVPPPEPRTVTPENKRTTKSPYRKAETGKSRFSGMGFAIGKGASRRLLCREEKLEQVKRLTELYKTKKKNGEKVPGKIREIIANDLKLSSTQVGRYERINKNLIPELKEILENGKSI